MPPIEHAASPMNLVDHFEGQDSQSQLMLGLLFLAQL